MKRYSGLKKIQKKEDKQKVIQYWEGVTVRYRRYYYMFLGRRYRFLKKAISAGNENTVQTQKVILEGPGKVIQVPKEGDTIKVDSGRRRKTNENFDK